jgi:His/Glu/Gln/Arg/opine family amino acid ABC transporter permease subunit
VNLKFDLIWPYIPFILGGLKVTFEYAILSVCLGIVGGSLLAMVKVCPLRWARFLAAIYTSIFRGTPLLVQLSIIYYALPQLFPIQLSPFTAGIITFSLNSSAYVSEIIRSGLLSLDKGQLECAYVLGIPKWLVFRDIVVPQTIRRTLPSLVNEIIDLLKESSLVSVIGEADLLWRARVAGGEHYLYFEPLIIAAVAYYVSVMILTFLAKLLERRLAPHA